MTTKHLVVVDCGIGNLTSVTNALAAVGAQPERTSDPAVLRRATHVVLPGVGAFADGMASLRTKGWIPELEKAVLDRGALFLGICLGMQLMGTTGEENGSHPGLGWLRSPAVKLQASGSERLPHIGWNDITPVGPSPLLEDSTKAFYFLHSYGIPASDPDTVARCDYGAGFAAVVHRGNLHGVQFHPEKSHKEGLSLLRAFATL